MQRRGLTAAVIVAVLAFLAPILVSLRFAWDESVAEEKDQGINYAGEVLRRGEETGRQFYSAVSRLNNDHFARCSPEEIDLMRQIDLGSSFIQMVGRISGDKLECTSLGTTKPMDLGPPTLVTSHGIRERLNFSLGPRTTDMLDLLDSDGVAVVIDTRLLVDLSTEENGVALAVVVPSTPSHISLVESGGPFRPEWFDPVPPGRATSLITGGYVVSQVRSRQYDIAAISVVPGHYASSHIRRFAAAFVPTGLLCGIVLGWAVIFLIRTQYSLAGLIREAARNQDFFVEYQPIVEVATRRLVGAEALVRWKRGNTVISPANFVGLAEESGAITVVTEKVMGIVARDLPGLLRLDPEFHVGINLTASDLKNLATVERLRELLKKSGSEARNVMVEATEHGLLGGTETRAVFDEIKKLGIAIAIDDFGTGYSSLSYLENLDIDVLKIDKAFVDTIETDGPTSRVVLHIIEMTHSLQLRSIAEGVETEAQARFLETRGVELAQGWLFGRPMSIDALCKLLANNRVEA